MEDIKKLQKQGIEKVVEYKWVIIVLFGISSIYFILRLTNILSLPIFTDEAIYLRWAEIAKQDANWRFISLTDGKQPLFIWFTMFFMRFIHDPLLAGRAVSVVAGFFTLLGLFFLGKTLFQNVWIGVLSSLLYLLFPMAFVYDRMAVYDGLVATTMVWSLFAQVLLIRKISIERGYNLGFIMGAAVLNKTTGFIGMILLPFSLLLYDFHQKHRVLNLLRWACFSLIAVIIAYVMYSILRLSPFYYIIAQKNAIFYYPLGVWFHFPLMVKIHNFQSNFQGLWDWFITYLTWPVLLLIVASFFVVKAYTKEKILLLLWFLLPFLALCVTGKTLYPRYVFFMAVPLLPLAAFTIYIMYKEIKSTLFVFAFVFVLLLMQLRADYFVLTDFKDAPIAQADVHQYVSGWPAGGGVKETVDYISTQAQNGKVFVATEGTFGLMPYALQVYLANNPNVIIQGFWPIGKTLPQQALDYAKKMPSYFVFYQPPHQSLPASMPLKLVFAYQQGNSQYYYRLYQIIPQ